MKHRNYAIISLILLISLLTGCVRTNTYAPTNIYENIHNIGLLAVLADDDPKDIDLYYSPSSLKDEVSSIGGNFGAIGGAIGSLMHVAIDQNELNTTSSNDLKSIKPKFLGVKESNDRDMATLKSALIGFNLQDEFNENFFRDIIIKIERREKISATLIDYGKYNSIQGEELISKIKRENKDLDAILTVFYAYGVGHLKEGGFKPAVVAQVSIINLRNDTILMSEVSQSTALYISSHSFDELTKNNAELFRNDFRKVADNFGVVVAINNF